MERTDWRLIPVIALTFTLLACGGGGSSTTANEVPAANNEDNNGSIATTLQAQADSATTPQGQTITIDVLANDSVTGRNIPTIVITGAPRHGKTEVRDSKVAYTPAYPNETFLGEDSFVYQINDESGNSSVASVSINVTCPSQPCVRRFEATWNPVVLPGVAGYCLYHAAESGAPWTERVCVDSDINVYQWTLPVATGIDVFAIRTLDTNGTESVYSAEVQVKSF